MGSGMAKLALQKEGLKIVAAVDARPDYVGKDLGEVLKLDHAIGVTVTDQPETVLDKTMWTWSSSPPLPGPRNKCPICARSSKPASTLSRSPNEMSDPAAQSPPNSPKSSTNSPKKTAFPSWAPASTPRFCPRSAGGSADRRLPQHRAHRSLTRQRPEPPLRTDRDGTQGVGTTPPSNSAAAWLTAPSSGMSASPPNRSA